jgi:hypothetical protein
VYHVSTRYARTLTEVLTDHNLTSLGDAHVNLDHSLTLSKRNGKPRGEKVRGKMLAQTIRKAGLKEYLSSRMTRHMLGVRAELLIIHASLHDLLTLEETVTMLGKTDEAAEGFG